MVLKRLSVGAAGMFISLHQAIPLRPFGVALIPTVSRRLIAL